MITPQTFATAAPATRHRPRIRRGPRAAGRRLQHSAITNAPTRPLVREHLVPQPPGRQLSDDVQSRPSQLQPGSRGGQRDLPRWDPTVGDACDPTPCAYTEASCAGNESLEVGTRLAATPSPQAEMRLRSTRASGGSELWQAPALTAPPATWSSHIASALPRT